MSEIEVRGSGEIANLQEGLDAERALWRSVFFSSLVAIPICAVLWVGLAALALAIADTSQGLVIPLTIAGAVGCAAGAFFGGWAGFLKKAHDLDEVDSRHRP